ncbi:MAG TPA: hypothetical protein VFA48_06075 [Gammaproteobacteria bacterium]|nr:hypothetical protein [Gammaproteobacteria bacterium]
MAKFKVIVGGGEALHNRARRQLFDALNRGNLDTVLSLKAGVYARLEPRRQWLTLTRHERSGSR